MCRRHRDGICMKWPACSVRSGFHSHRAEVTHWSPAAPRSGRRKWKHSARRIGLARYTTATKTRGGFWQVLRKMIVSPPRRLVRRHDTERLPLIKLHPSRNLNLCFRDGAARAELSLHLFSQLASGLALTLKVYSWLEGRRRHTQLGLQVFVCFI